MDSFRAHLESRGFSPRTVESYVHAIDQLIARVEKMSDNVLLDHKEWLISGFSARTANARIAAINVYLDHIGYEGIRLKAFKIQQRPFLENVIGRSDYEKLRDGTLRDGELFWHFTIRYLACTGVRVSEFRRFEVQHVRCGCMDLRAKGDKMRRVYIPESLCVDTEKWLHVLKRRSGPLFVGENGKVMTARGISLGLKRMAKRYDVNPDVVYPHSFRHFFAKSFIRNNPDIALLSDLLGHESIETTRVYLRRTAEEQREAVDLAVDW